MNLKQSISNGTITVQGENPKDIYFIKEVGLNQFGVTWNTETYANGKGLIFNDICKALTYIKQCIKRGN